MMRSPLILNNPIQPYAWGSRTAIQELLGSPEKGAPWAELWMGAHPKAPSTVIINGERLSLDHLVRQYPEEILGAAVANKFKGVFPFLFKVLAAAVPLSLQAHPDRYQAASGFERENQQQIPLNSPKRNYRDPNHKPEIICALNRFTSLKGFRPVHEMITRLEKFCPEGLSDEINMLKAEGGNATRHLFKALMNIPKTRKQRVIKETMKNAVKSDPENSENRWISRLYDRYPEDIGILSPAFLNLIELEPGQALFLPAGELHAYLEGTGMELMANSDNVLRGGMTSKHIDVNELMNILNFSESETLIRTAVPAGPAESVYPICAEEFFLSKIRITENTAFNSANDRSAEILLCVEGHGKISYGPDSERLSITKGISVLVPSASPSYRITGDALIYKAAVPVSTKMDC